MERQRNSKKKYFVLQKKPIKIWDINTNKIVVSKLVKTKINSRYLIGRKFYKVIRLLVLVVLKMNGDIS